MPEGLNAGNIALNLTLNKDGFNRDLGNMQQTAAGIGKSIASSLGGAANSALGLGRKFVNASTTAARGFRSAEASITASGRRIASAVAGAFAITKIVQFANSCIKLGSDLTEMENVTNTVFPNMSKQVQEWSKAAANTAGQTETQAKNYIGTLGAMSKAFGFTEKEAFEMSSTVAQLTGDVSSFYNLTQDESFAKLKSIFTGEAESLKSLGVVMTQTALDEYAMANGFGKVTSQMTEMEKVSLRYAFVQDKLSAANGDFLRTTDSWANQTKRLKLNITEIQTALGQGMINILLPVIKLINTLLQRLVSLANAFRSFTSMFTGKKAESLNKGVAGLTSGINNTAAATDGLADSATSAGKAATAAAKAMKALFGFDNINKLTEDTSSGSGGGGGGGGAGAGDIIGDEFDMGTIDSDELADELNSKAKDLIDKADWDGLGRYAAQKINAGLEKIYDVVSWDNVGPKVTPVIDAVTGTFNGFVDELHWDQIGADIAEGINTAVKIANRLYTGVEWENLGKKIAEGANGLASHIDADGIGQLIGNKFNSIWGTAYGLVSEIHWGDLGKKAADGIKGYFDTAQLSLKTKTLAKFFNGLFESMEGFTKNLTDDDVKKIVDNIGGAINDYIATFDWKKNGTRLGDFVLKLVGAIADTINKIDWDELGEGIADFLGEAGPKLLQAGLSLAKALIKALVAGIKGLSTSDAGELALAIVGLKLTWNCASWATGIIGSLSGAFATTGNTNVLATGLSSVIKLALAHPLVTAAIGGIALGAILVDKAFTMSDDEIREFTTEITERAKKLGIGESTNYAGHDQDVEAANNGGLKQYKDTDYMYNPQTGNVYDAAGHFYNNAYEQGWITDTEEAKNYNNNKHSTFDAGSSYGYGNANGEDLSTTIVKKIEYKTDEVSKKIQQAYANTKDGKATKKIKGKQDKSFKNVNKVYSKLADKSATKKIKGKTDKSFTTTKRTFDNLTSKTVTAKITGTGTITTSIAYKTAADRKVGQLLTNYLDGNGNLRFGSGGMLGKFGIRHYAAGTSRAQGTLFVAGEAGSEVVGNINGHTEVLNKSQLAQTMFASVQAAMFPLVNSIRYATPRLAIRGDSRREIGYSDERIRQIAQEASAATGISNVEILEILRKILKWLEESDPDVYLDGKKISKRVFEEIRRVKNTTGRNPVLV